MRLIPDLILAALVAGVGWSLWANPALPSALPLLLLCLAALAVAVACRLFRIPAGPALLAAALLFGVWRAESAGASPAPAAITGTGITATVLITDAPATSGGGYRFRARVVPDPAGNPGGLPTDANLLVYALPPPELVARRGLPYLRYGDALRVSGDVDRPKPIGDFDYAAWLESQGITAVMWARQVELADAGGGSKPAAALHRLRSALALSIQRSIPEPQAGLAQALLLGIRSELPHSVKESFRNAGMSHLLAISGLHVGVVMGLTLAAASALAGRNNPAASIVTFLIVWAYALLSGLDPPVMRAAIMGSLFLAQGLLGRGMRGLTALLLAAAAMLAIDPHLLGSLSFQLSFTAMAGVIVALPLITALTAAANRAVPASGAWPARWAQYGLSLLIASVVISTTTTLATLPLVAWQFGAIPMMSIPATILAMPAMTAALLGAAATSIVGLLIPPLAIGLGALTWAPLAWLIRVAEAMPPWLPPAPWLTTPVAAAWLVLTASLAILASSQKVRRRIAALRAGPAWQPSGPAGVAAAAAPITLIAALLLAGQFSGTGADGLLHVYALDIGQGDSIFIATPDGRQMLVDGGPNGEPTLAAVSALLPPGDRSLDVVAVTHLDKDHAVGLLGALDRYRADIVAQSDHVPESAPLYPQWQAALTRRNHSAATLHAGHRIQLGRDVTLEVLYPPPDGLPPGSKRSANNGSLVARLDYGNVSFLLTGDIEAEAERYLAATAADKLRADVLKVAHHGSKSSTTPAFLNAVAPRTAVISAGRNNQFGHPHPEVMQRLQTALNPNAVFLTARDGTVEYITDGKTLWVKTHGPPGR